MDDYLPVPWWTFWLLASFVLYSGLIWLFVREATRARHGSSSAATTEEDVSDPAPGEDDNDIPAGQD